MKRILILIVLTIISLSGCINSNSVNEKNIVSKLNDKINNLTEYKVNAVMQINRDDVVITYDIEVSYMDDEFYKVVLNSRENDNEQIILKNENGVFILNPSLNKCFKFNDSWPNNSSHSYLLQSILKDVLNDETPVITISDDNYIIESKVSHKTNSNWEKQRVLLDKKTLFPSKVSILDNSGIEIVSISFDSYNLKPELSKDDFNEEKLLQSSLCINDSSKEMLSPTYLPVGSILETEDESDSRSIMYYSGDNSFTVSKKVIYEDISENEVVYIYGEPLLIDTGFAAVTNHSLTWFHNGIEYTIFSNNLNIEELIKIANSLE